MLFERKGYDGLTGEKKNEKKVRTGVHYSARERGITGKECFKYCRNLVSLLKGRLISYCKNNDILLPVLTLQIVNK